eukprot:TRINITY_DN2077_c2_g1_i2.p1 TRINITY_DN2077_c2_g1~~TRINITY_DN2077_c2_g1_i2.p1  ORF type:complete len:395 (+),score=116.81 TRINITY_DN2077_c2_g1_i2:129-1313(+)
MMQRKASGVNGSFAALTLLALVLLCSVIGTAVVRTGVEGQRQAVLALAADVRSLRGAVASIRKEQSESEAVLRHTIDSSLAKLAADLDSRRVANGGGGGGGGGGYTGGGGDSASDEKDDESDVDETTFLGIRNYTDAAAKQVGENPAIAAAIVRRWREAGKDMFPLMTPIHRALDYLMVRDCERKTGGKRGCIDGFVLPAQARKYFQWAVEWEPAGDGPVTLCETGFNAGHSAVTFLLGEPRLSMHSFDLFTQAYSHSALSFVKAVFGDGRMTLHSGDSGKSLTAAAQHKRFSCDALSVDGAHSFKACLTDVQGLARLLPRDGVPVLMDDTAEGFEMKGGPAEVWRKLKKEKKLVQERCVPLGTVEQWKRGSRPKPRGFCIGTVNRNLRPFDDE